MREQERWHLADAFSKMMYTLMELEHQKGELDLDSKMRRLKDLSAYSLAHDITYRRQGVELSALAKRFGLAIESRFHKNRERLDPLPKETTEYQGQAENIEREIKERGRHAPPKPRPGDPQPRLL